jgi:intein/homing endonuclease
LDDILILYDQQEIDEQMILEKISGVNKNLQFKMSTEANNTINYLDTLIRRDSKGITIELYRKPTKTGRVIHFTSNHPFEH